MDDGDKVLQVLNSWRLNYGAQGILAQDLGLSSQVALAKLAVELAYKEDIIKLYPHETRRVRERIEDARERYSARHLPRR